MAMFKSTVVGKIIDIKVSKKGNKFLKVYDGSSLQNIFVDAFDEFERGQEVVLPCEIYTDSAYIKYSKEE